jgi:NADPH-dependent 2,4-dienoyl-CoA reductase/sulfur reductase-like enzyme
MQYYKYLIVGGGMTADAAAHGIREVDPDGSIGLIGAEQVAPYDRPPLTKGLWKGKPLEKIQRNTAATGAELHLGRRVIALDPANHCVVDDQGSEYGYDRLLLATGGAPRRLPFGGDGIIYYRTINDYTTLRDDTVAGSRVAVIGAGFIGSEIAAALAMNGRGVDLLTPDEYIGQRLFPRPLAAFVTEYYRERGVQVHTLTSATGLERREDRWVLQTESRRDHERAELVVDRVVAGIGIVPNVELAQAAGATVENGIVVDGSCRTSVSGVYAAGDVASFYNPALDIRMRVEHEDNANTMGRFAGRSMAGRTVSYDHLPFFYSDLFDLGYEAVGEIDSRLEMFADWEEPFRKGIVYYLKAGRVHGVLLWNVWDQVDAARSLIAERSTHRPEDLRGRLPR